MCGDATLDEVTTNLRPYLGLLEFCAPSGYRTWSTCLECPLSFPFWSPGTNNFVYDEKVNHKAHLLMSFKTKSVDLQMLV